jgi:hypothetical protein
MNVFYCRKMSLGQQVAHACNPSYLGSKDHCLRPAQAKSVRAILTSGWVQWCVPVNLA